MPAADDRVNLYDLGLPQLEEVVARLGRRPYHALQVWRCLYRQRVTSFDEMADLPADLRRPLSEIATLRRLEPVREAVSADGMAVKVHAMLHDGTSIESVLIRYPAKGSRGGRHTVCLSSQVGCAVGCPFCATGEMGFVRNLTAGEIVAQVLYFAREHPIDNLVFMGMGEPLLNYENTWQAVKILGSPQGFGLGPRRFTISTAGIVPGILRLAGERPAVNLAVSLHAPNDELRNALVPIGRKYPLAALMAACDGYTSRTGRRIGYQYVMLAGINDSAELGHELGRLLQGRAAHVNLIPVNPAPGRFQRPGGESIWAFREIVQSHGIRAIVRAEKGTQISAACGQLAGHPPRLSPGQAFRRNGE